MSSRNPRPPTHARLKGRPEPSRPESPRGDRRHRTVADFCAEWEISRRTFYEWRAKGRAPKCIKLPNGDLRISRAAYEAWLKNCEESA